jgi:hypothetical protein
MFRKIFCVIFTELKKIKLYILLLFTFYILAPIIEYGRHGLCKKCCCMLEYFIELILLLLTYSKIFDNYFFEAHLN